MISLLEYPYTLTTQTSTIRTKPEPTIEYIYKIKNPKTWLIFFFFFLDRNRCEHPKTWLHDVEDQCVACATSFIFFLVNYSLDVQRDDQPSLTPELQLAIQKREFCSYHQTQKQVLLHVESQQEQNKDHYSQTSIYQSCIRNKRYINAIIICLLIIYDYSSGT